MSFMNYGRGSRVSRRYWLETTRTFIGRALLWLGNRFGDWMERAALRIAPWLDGNRCATCGEPIPDDFERFVQGNRQFHCGCEPRNRRP